MHLRWGKPTHDIDNEWQERVIVLFHGGPHGRWGRQIGGWPVFFPFSWNLTMTGDVLQCNMN